MVTVYLDMMSLFTVQRCFFVHKFVFAQIIIYRYLKVVHETMTYCASQMIFMIPITTDFITIINDLLACYCYYLLQE